MGINYLERQVLRRGHQLQRPGLREYGCDAAMLHFSEDGQIEDGEVRFQVKATDSLSLVDDGRNAVCRIETAHIRHWYWQLYPFVLVLFDARKERAYWLHIQAEVDQRNDLLSPRRKTVSLRLPVSNTLSVRAIDRFRTMSLNQSHSRGQFDE